MGNSEMSFNQEQRYPTMKDLAVDLRHMWVLVNRRNGRVLGACKIEVNKENDVALLGPWAVCPKQQVRLSFCLFCFITVMY